MKNIKVSIDNTEDLVCLNENMMRYKDLNFDIHVGSINLDGKSLIGLLGLGARKFEIRISGADSSLIKDFISKIEKYIV